MFLTNHDHGISPFRETIVTEGTGLKTPVYK